MQGWELQSRVCMWGPTQLLPPYRGGGELQKRSRVWTPESHSDEHSDHADHVDQPPCTAEANGNVKTTHEYHSMTHLVPKYGDMCCVSKVLQDNLFKRLRICISVCTWTVYCVTGLMFLSIPKAGGRVSVVTAPKAASQSHSIHVIETCLTALRPWRPLTPWSSF